jgi:hypothetical protein
MSLEPLPTLLCPARTGQATPAPPASRVGDRSASRWTCEGVKVRLTPTLGLPRCPTAQTVPGPTAAASHTVPVVGVVSVVQLEPFQRITSDGMFGA